MIHNKEKKICNEEKNILPNKTKTSFELRLKRKTAISIQDSKRALTLTVNKMFYSDNCQLWQQPVWYRFSAV